MEKQSFLLERVASPTGVMLLVTDARERVRALDWEDHDARMQRLLRLHYRGAAQIEPRRGPSPARRALAAYFEGQLDALDGLEVKTAGTPFQRGVWKALRAIPVGETATYGGLARTLGCPKAMRAVGAANGSNPVAIIVPCHRVVGVNGALTGFGGGIERKRWLLRHEGHAAKSSLQVVSLKTHGAMV